MWEYRSGRVVEVVGESAVVAAAGNSVVVVAAAETTVEVVGRMLSRECR